MRSRIMFAEKFILFLERPIKVHCLPSLIAKSILYLFKIVAVSRPLTIKATSMLKVDGGVGCVAGHASWLPQQIVRVEFIIAADHGSQADVVVLESETKCT